MDERVSLGGVCAGVGVPGVDAPDSLWFSTLSAVLSVGIVTVGGRFGRGL